MRTIIVALYLFWWWMMSFVRCIPVRSQLLISRFQYLALLQPHYSRALVHSDLSWILLRFFNSPLLVSTTVQSVGGLVQFNPTITYRNNTVYYWRVAPVSGSASPNWNQASFHYRTGNTTGMGQSHFYQHLLSDTIGVRLDSANRLWRFKHAAKSLEYSLMVFSLQLPVHWLVFIWG